jgi:hypothetical protein
MTYDPKSPTNKYLPQVSSRRPANLPVAQYIPPLTTTTGVKIVGGVRFTPEVLNSPQAKDFLDFLAEGNEQALAEALVYGRLEQFQYRRDLVNFSRRLLGLAERPKPSHKLFSDVLAKLRTLYAEFTKVLKERNAYNEELISHQTKRGDLAIKQQRQQREFLEEEVKIATLKGQLANLRQGPPAEKESDRRAQERADRLEEDRLKTELSNLRLQRAQHAEERRKLQEPPPLPPPPPPQLSYAERFLKDLRAELQRLGTKLSSLDEIDGEMTRWAAALREKGHEPGTDLYEYTVNAFQDLRRHVLTKG